MGGPGNIFLRRQKKKQIETNQWFVIMHEHFWKNKLQNWIAKTYYFIVYSPFVSEFTSRTKLNEIFGIQTYTEGELLISGFEPGLEPPFKIRIHAENDPAY